MSAWNLVTNLQSSALVMPGKCINDGSKTGYGERTVWSIELQTPHVPSLALPAATVTVTPQYSTYPMFDTGMFHSSGVHNDYYGVAY